MNEYIPAASLPGRRETALVSIASRQDRTEGWPVRLDTIDEAPGSGHESFEDGILALLPMLHTWLDRDLQAALAGLPEPFRRTVELCDIQGLSYQEAAHALGCALGTVMSRLHRGRAMLREALTGSDRGQWTGVPARARTRRSIGEAADRAAVPEERAA